MEIVGIDQAPTVGQDGAGHGIGSVELGAQADLHRGDDSSRSVVLQIFIWAFHDPFITLARANKAWT